MFKIVYKLTKNLTIYVLYLIYTLGQKIYV